MRRADNHNIAQGGVFPKGLITKEGAFNLFGTNAVARDVNDIIRATVEREAAVLVTPGIVTLSIAVALGPAIEIHRLEAVNIATPSFAAKVFLVTPKRMRQIGVGASDY